MKQKKPMHPRNMRTLCASFFALSSITPILLFTFHANRHGLLQDGQTQLLIGLSVAVAVLGFLAFFGVIRQIMALAEMAHEHQWKQGKLGGVGGREEIKEVTEIRQQIDSMRTEIMGTPPPPAE